MARKRRVQAKAKIKSRPRGKPTRRKPVAWRVKVILDRVRIPDTDCRWHRGAISFETTAGVLGDRARTWQMVHPKIGGFSPTQLAGLCEKELGTVVFEGVVQRGDELVVRLEAFENVRRPDRARNLRYERLFSGDPSRWTGEIRPGFEPRGVVARWRVWYRVEVKPTRSRVRIGDAVLESLDHRRIADARELEIWGGKLPDARAGIELQCQEALLRECAQDPQLPPDETVERAVEEALLYLVDTSEIGVRGIRNPAPKESFGYASRAVEVALPEGYRGTATLVVPLDAKALQRVDRRSIRLFRWEEPAGWSIATNSGVHPDADIAWATTARGGTYVAVGLPRDPLLRKYVCFAHQLEPVFRAARAYGNLDFHDRLCQVILCVDFLQRAPFFEDEWGNLQLGWTEDRFERAVMDRIRDDGGLMEGTPFGGRKQDLLGWVSKTGRRRQSVEVPTYDPTEGPSDDRGFPRAYPPGGFEPGAEWGTGGSICDRCFGIPFPDRIPERVLCEPPIVIGPFPPATSCKKWKSIGPSFPPGPVRDLAVHPTNGRVIYAAADAGGLWKTTNGGTTWRALTDHLLNPNAEAVVVSRADTSLVYMGTRSWLLGGDFDLYVSEDGGNSWRRSGAVPSNDCNGLATASGARETVYFAGERGLHKSTDLGDSWIVQDCTVDGAAKVNVESIFDGNVTHVVMDPNLDNTLYIAVSGHGILRTMDGGLSWTSVSGNLVGMGLTGRTILAIGQDTRPGRSGTNFLVARNGDLVAFSKNAKSANPTWTLLPQLVNYWNDPINGDGGGTYGGWCQALAVNPDDEDMIVTGGIYLAKTTNATGAAPTWSLVPGNTWPNWDSSVKNEYHPDQQSLEWHPTDSTKFLAATDGNVVRFDNHGASVTRISDGLTNTWCYNVGVSQTGPFVAGSATFHVGSIRKVSGSLRWEYVDTAEFGIYEIDPNRSHVHFDSPSGSFKRSDQNGDRGTWVDKKHLLDGGVDGAGDPLSVAGPRMLVFRPDNSDVIFVGAGRGRLHVSLDNGVDWDFVKGPDGAGAIVPFLPTGAASGRPSALAFAPSNNDVVYLGTSNGNLWKSTTGGLTRPSWGPLAVPSPSVANAMIQHLAVHPTDPDVVYVGYSATGTDQLYRSDDGGAGWDPVTGAANLAVLPQYPVRSIVIDPSRPDTVFVALRIGVYVTHDGGDWWRPFDEGLPRVTVGGMSFRRVTRTLYLATEGRGVFSRQL